MRKLIALAALLFTSCIPDIESAKKDIIDQIEDIKSTVESQVDEIQSQIEGLSTDTCIVSVDAEKTIYACRTEFEDYVMVCVGTYCERM